MKTLHNRCAGLDVHKVEVVACLRVVNKRKLGHEVRRFPKPVEYSCVYFVPDGKRKEQELEKKEWGWVKVQITMENVQNGTDL